MTAHALVEERERCLAAGMNDHVTKPIDPDALFAALTRWTKHRAQTSPLSRASGCACRDNLPRGRWNRHFGRPEASRRQPATLSSLLEQFVVKQADVSARIADALERNDRELAERLAHTVKGVAGNIGMIHTQEAAGKLEKALRDNGPAIPTLLSELESAVASQISSIGSALSETVPHVANASEFDAAAAAVAIARLELCSLRMTGMPERLFRWLSSCWRGRQMPR